MRSMFFQKLPKLVLFGSGKSHRFRVCRSVRAEGVVSSLLLNLVCIVGQMTIWWYFCGVSKAMDGWGRGDTGWWSCGWEQGHCSCSCLWPCTEAAEEPEQSCLCSCWCRYSRSEVLSCLDEQAKEVVTQLLPAWRVDELGVCSALWALGALAVCQNILV